MGCPYQAISHHNRRRILKYLSNGEHTASSIASKFHLSQATISYHLKVLKEANIISNRQVKQQIFYYIKDQRINSMISFLYSIVKDK